MATKPFPIARISDFAGLSDDLAVQAGEQQGSVVQNWLKKRRSLVRRPGFSALGAAALSPDTDLRLLEYTKHGDTEHVLGVHDTDVVDFLASPVGEVVPNGAGRLPSSGSAEANGAWVDGNFYLGNGLDQNLRYNGESETFAASFDGTDVLEEPGGGSTGIYAGSDFTLSGWVKFDTLTGEQVVCSIYNGVDTAETPFVVKKDNGSDKLRFLCINNFGVNQELVTSTVTLVVGQWHHFFCRHDGGTNISISVDGEAMVNQAFVAGVPEPTDVPFVVGGVANSSSFPLDGAVGPLGFWRTANAGGGALANGDATTLYNGGVALRYTDLSSALKTNLDAWWDMTEESGTRVDSHGAFDLSPAGSGVGSVVGPLDPLTVAQVMVDPVTTAPTIVTSISGSDTHPADTFEYRISFLNADGAYGEAGPAASVTVAQAFDSSVQSIPQPPAGQDASGIRIWRRSGGNTTFRFVADVTVGTTVYIDEVLNADLGEELIESNTRFPPCRYFTAWGRRLVGALCLVEDEGEVTHVMISNEDEPWYCPLLPDDTNPTQGARMRLQGRAAGTPTGVQTHGGVVAVFTGGAGWLLRGDQPGNFTQQQFTSHGCVAHRTIISARDLLLWLSDDGVYAWVGGGAVQRISDDVRTTLEGLTAAQLSGAHASLFDDRYYLFWDSGALVFDLEYRVWTEYGSHAWHNSTVAEFVGASRQRLWAAHEGHARVYQLETGTTDALPAAATAITATWATRDWDMGMPGRDKRVHYLEIKCRKTSAPATALVSLFRGTGELVQRTRENIAQSDRPGAEVARLLIPCVEQARDEHFRVQVEITSTAANVELLAVGAMYKLAS